MAARQIKPPISIPKPGSAGSSPAQQTKLQSLLPATEAVQKPPPEVLTVQMFQAAMKEVMRDIKEGVKEDMAKEMKEVKEMIQSKDKQLRENITEILQGLVSHVNTVEKSVEEIKQANVQFETKCEELQIKIDKVDDDVTLTQYRAMELALRVRGLKEDPKEDLRQILIEALANLLGVPRGEIDFQMDRVYRVNSWIARQRKLPRDIVVYFLSRRMRNQILQATYNTKLEVAGQQLAVFKEIPVKMLRAKKEYAFLVDELKNRQIQYRWEIPAGVVVNLSGERYRLNTVQKAREFYRSVLNAGVPPMDKSKKKDERPREEMELGKGDLISIEDTLEQQEETFQLTGALQALQVWAASGKPENGKEQRETRAAKKRKEEELKKQQEQALAQGNTSIQSEAVGGARPKMDYRAALTKLRDNENGS